MPTKTDINKQKKIGKTIMRKIICIVMTIMVSLMASTAKAQFDDAAIDQITEQLSESDVSEVNQALQQIERAKAMLEQVASKQKQADKLRAEAQKASKGDAKKKIKQAVAIEQPLYTQQVNAYNVYEKANTTIYGIFANNIKELASIGGGSESDVIDLTNFATDTWGKAEKALKTVPKGKKPDQKAVANIKQDVNKNQIRAIQYQIEAYKFLLGFSGSNNSAVTTRPQTDDVVDNAFFNHFAEDDEDDSDNTTAVATTTSPSQPRQNSTPNNDTMDDEGFNFVQGGSTADRIIYKVQVAADAIPLNITKLRQICPTDDIINNEQQNGIYRYTVGYYTSYDEAKARAIELRGKGVEGAFVVAYKNGVRIKEIRDVFNN